MRISPVGIQLIKEFEGCRRQPYFCPANYWTIGWGHVITAKEAQRFAKGINQETADALLKLDLVNAERAVLSLSKVPLNQSQFDALVSFVFNLGKGRFKTSTLRMKLNRADYDGAAGQFTRWCFAAGKKLAGLLRRRIAERDLFST